MNTSMLIGFVVGAIVSGVIGSVCEFCGVKKPLVYWLIGSFLPTVGAIIGDYIGTIK